MSFIASASDSLISPVNAVNGQTLTWNATTGQFEPTTITATGAESPAWVASTAYLLGDIAAFTFAGVSTLLRRTSAGTSGTTINATELANWEYISQVSSPPFPASTLVPAGFKIAVSAGNLYESTGNNTTSALFNGAEQLNWRALSEPECRPWAPNLFYVGGDLVFQVIGGLATYLRRVSIGTSGASFDVTELATWNYLAQAGIPTNFPANTLVPSRFQISINGVLYFSNTDRTTGATFDVTEQGFWTALTSAGTTLPTLTDLRGLRGDGTGIPVADARLQYGTANASTIDFNLNGSDGIRLSSVGGNNLITNAGTPNGSPLTIRTQDSAAGLNNFPGNLNLSTGSGTGSGEANIVFSTCLPTVSGTTVTNPTPIWTMGQDAFASTLTANRVGGGGVIQAVFNESLNVRTLGSGTIALSPIGSGALNMGAAGTGAITIGTTAKTTTIFGIAKKPTMAYLKTNAAANTIVAANTNTVVAFTGGVTNGTGISLAASTFTLARTGFYSIRLKVSFQSATTNVRGLVFLAGSTAVFAGTAPQKAFRTANVANANQEIEAAWDVQVTTAGNFTVQIVATAAGTVNLNNGATATAATTEVTILEIG